MSIRLGLDIGSETVKSVLIREDQSIEVLDVLRVLGQPLRRVKEIIEKVLYLTSYTEVICGVTGTGAPPVGELIGADVVHEPNALAASIGWLYPEVRTVIEMGRETQKYIFFERDPVSGRLLVEESSLGNKCASGSGSFLDHMAKRLNYGSVEEFAGVALDAGNPATLSGRCAVFTESDIVHLYQKGTPRERIAAGVHQAIARNYRSAIARGREFRDKIIFIGGVSENPAALKYIAEELELNGRISVPEYNRTLGAIGAAMRAESVIDLREAVSRIERQIAKPIEYPGCEPIRLYCNRHSYEMSGVVDGWRHWSSGDVCFDGLSIDKAGLGIDIGSVSTKAALVTEIDGRFVILASYYRRTDGDPLSAVRDTLSKIHEQIQKAGLKINKIVAATTGSGRYLTGDYIGADLIKNEITAQASGALSYAGDIDSIFEIGGQDSKFIRLDGETIIDFEMNKACAAGTGAFLEKQAERLGIPLEEFGDVALRNTRPPDLDWTCTVFSESAMVYYQQNNVPVEDLAAGICLASVRNYLNKNVGSRDIGEKIAFQGAVAFNKGMVAAFETVLGKEIMVPPYPHITGAVGAARLAYLADVKESRFRGFDKIAEARYTVTSFECKGCPNRCDVNTFQLEGGPKYYYNDRCEKFSAVQKKNFGEGLPDLFAEREKMMMEAYKPSRKEDFGECGDAGRKLRVGIPRGLMFSEYYPLYAGFFGELGFEVVPSDPTNKHIIEIGLEVSVGEPCFPFKVAHGHHMNLIEKGVDIIFSPGVHSTEQPSPNLRQAQTCPYVQAAPEVIASAIGITERGIKYLTPRLHFKRGVKHLRRVFVQVGKELGKSAKQSLEAFEVGWRALHEFRKRVEARGMEVLRNLPQDAVAFVVVGRPYTLWDPAVNMDIGKKIQDLGILAIPQDFLPIDAVDISDVWPNAYSRQIQKKLAAARIIRQDLRLRAVVLTYFGCGPDSFGNPFFKDEIGEPCYIMQIDEHTADAGVITRIEAFADTAVKRYAKQFYGIRTTDTAITKLGNRRLWIPYANEDSRVLAAAMRAYGIDAAVLPRSPDSGLNLARKVISEDVCLPALMTTEDMLYRVNQPDFDPRGEAFFQGNSEGPCRFGMYSILQRRILDKLGLEEVDIVTLGAISEHGGLGTMFALLAYDGFVTHDLLFKMMCRVRPYEICKGQAKAVYQRYVRELESLIPEHKKRLEAHKLAALRSTRHLEEFQDLLKRAQEDFARIPRREEDRPLVGVVGEFYVRIHDGANQDILRKLEAEGAETWLAPPTEFFTYVNYLGKMLSMDRIRDCGLSLEELREFMSRWVNCRLAEKDEHALFRASLPFLEGYDDIGPRELIEYGSAYVNYNFGGEAICSMGKSEDFARRGLAGIVSVIPFNCMPGNTVSALSHSLRRRHGNIPFLSIDYDGFIDASREAKIVSFMWQVKERYYGRRGARQVTQEDLEREKATI